MISHTPQKIRELYSKVNGGLIIIIILSFIVGWQLGHRDYNFQIKNYKPQFKVTNQSPASSTTDIDFKLFWETWDLVSQKYIDKTAIDPQKLYYGAIQGMVAALGDPYTVFLPPQAQKSTKEQLSGSFEGVGIQLGYNKEKRLVVIAPLKDTPADRAGVKAGDLIVKINDKEAFSLSLPEAVSQIRGPKGSTVNLSVLRENESKPKDITLTRDTIVVKSVEFENKNTDLSQKPDSPTVTKTTKSGKEVAYIRLSQFGERTRNEWDLAVSEGLSHAPQGVIVDVRNNPGGFLDGAVYIASEFLDRGVIVIQEDALGNKESQQVIREGKLLKLPVVILINKGSASASEILAGAIQDRKRGTLVGEQSFGKGTIQSSEDLPEGTGIHITTAKWLTPDGRWIHNKGLTPDVIVENTEDGKDIQLEKALEVLDK
ncbi:MAG: S41 family peptidase [Candidatus Daviesbacteria bacterium]|nr:S41 family peptidase [Candidatus Daviesbacteria bacterium]